MKHSIAKQVTHRVTLLLLTVIIIFVSAAFLIVHKVINEKTQNYTEAIVTVFSDTILYDAHIQNVPVNTDFAESIIFRGDYICRWYELDFAYLYIPDPESGGLRILAVSGSEQRKEQLNGNMIGALRMRKIDPEEIAVWNGEKLFGHYISDNEYGHEMCTVLRVEDDFGNAMLAAVDISFDKIAEQIIHTLLLMSVVIAVVIVAVDILVYVILRQRVSKPAQKLSRVMHDYITDGKRSVVQLHEDGDDEYAMIASAFNSMTKNIDRYLDDIGELTRVQQKQQTELEIAAKIQKGFLPPEYHAALGYEIHAMMKPARDVGGDLYDYLRLDDHRVLLVVADVSGKGISAALFMAVTLVVIRQFAKMNLSPAEILRQTNDLLSQNNAAMLFATVFIGIYDRNKRELTYSNAGHNHPYLLGDSLRCLDKAAGTLVGLFEDETYEEATEKMASGDVLFFYTDGVSEATNERRQFFGEKRLEDVLGAYRKSGTADPVSHVSRAVSAFSGNFEQHDDITMLALTVKDRLEFDLDYDVHEFQKIKEAILDLPIERQRQLSLCLASEELFVNICSYAFEGRDVPEGEKIRFTLSLTDKIEITLEDGGQPFDPLANVVSPDDYDMETQIGGLGDYIAMSSVDDMHYEYKNGKNVLTFIMYLKEKTK